jgi:hypothetical protein
MPPLSTWGKNSERRRKGVRIRQEIKIETSITGITAFFSNDTFLNTSYDPNNIAETKARNNHILIYNLLIYNLRQSNHNS